MLIVGSSQKQDSSGTVFTLLLPFVAQSGIRLATCFLYQVYLRTTPAGLLSSFD